MRKPSDKKSKTKAEPAAANANAAAAGSLQVWDGVRHG
jgi:hypothetical protein